MNSVERTYAALYNEKYDITPVIPLIIQHSLNVSGITHGEYSTSGKKMAQAQLAAIQKYDYDGLHISTDNYIISEVLGNTVKILYDEPPQKEHKILGSTKDLSILNKDFRPQNAGRMPVILEAASITRDALKDTKFIKCNCDSGPFSVAASLRGEERLFFDIYDDEQFVFDLLEITSNSIIRYAKALAVAGAHAITYGESTASLLNYELFEKIVLPFNKYVIGEIQKTGLPVFYHMCGNVNHLLDLLSQTGANCIELDSYTDLNLAYEKTKYCLCIEGNINTVDLLLSKTKTEVEEACKNTIEISCGKNLILSSGCELPRNTPYENVFAMVNSAKKYFFV